MSSFDTLVKKLKEIFQIDRSDLDFGIYRILNARSQEIEEFLTNRLKKKVEQALSSSGDTEIEELGRQLKEAEAKALDVGVPPEQSPKVQELKSRMMNLKHGNVDEQNQVFSHLLIFFSRYYDNGDFISQRRYKGDTYAIPYAGEEVMLHWANKDQYYTKSGEHFTNYSFKLMDGRTVHFRLASADVAKDNRKESEKNRLFALCERRMVVREDGDGETYEEEQVPIQEKENELTIWLEYKSLQDKIKQDVLVKQAVDSIGKLVSSNWLELFQLQPTEKQPKRTVLEKHLLTYTTKNTADYFIHKDLDGFLRRELDFYIKNEVMNLDDIENVAVFANVEKHLRMIQCLRKIAGDIINFLAQIENFQKSMWEKKKFVVEAHYCVTLDQVPEELYTEITANTRQWEQWRDLGMGPENGERDLLASGTKFGSMEYLRAHPYLMVDTGLFPATFKEKLLGELDDLDEKLDGLMIHGDNFQALNILVCKYRDSLDAVYIDPPYNVTSSEILYKNNFKHSSWLSFLDSRLNLSKSILSKNGLIAVAIDDYEASKLWELLNEIFGYENHLGTLVIRNNPKGRMTNRKVSLVHEYTFLFGKSDKSLVKKLPVNPEEKTHNYKQDENGEWYLPVNLRKQGVDSEAERPDGSLADRYFPVFYNPDTGEVSTSVKHRVEIFPVDSNGYKRIWRRSKDVIDEMFNRGEVWVNETKQGTQIYFKFRGGLDGQMVQSILSDAKCSASDYGTKILDDVIGKRELFSYPKAPFAVETIIQAMSNKKNATILDFFAGSGTTGQSVISLNRSDKPNGKRKYILVEQGEYFNTVTKPRIQKVVYSEEWKAGNPTKSETGISHAFKYMKIESYEDTLNNIELKRDQAEQGSLVQLKEEARSQYLMHYMMDIESRGSMLNVDHFRKPFDYELKIATDSAGAYETQKIDLVETFNYLIGLKVKYINSRMAKGYVIVDGVMPNGDKAVVIWRDCDLISYDELNRLLERGGDINPRSNDYDVIYVNGDHNISNITTTASADGIPGSMKVRSIEAEFLSAMFGEG